MQAIISDLSYVRVGNCWNYICILLDLFNREIVGYQAGRNKTADLVARTFSTIDANLNKIMFFHTDRGKEFDNKLIDNLLTTFDMQRSLSKKGCPYDNAVAEATFKVIKTEFIKNRIFNNLDDLKYQLADYVNWFNKKRIHSALGYLSPIEYKEMNL